MAERERDNERRERVERDLQPSRAREAWWSLQERVLWPLADRARDAFDAARWPFEEASWALRERALWPLQDRLSEVSGGRIAPRAATASVLAVVALGSLGAGALVASGGDGDAKGTQPVVAAAPNEDEIAGEVEVPVDALTEPEPKAPALKGPLPKFGAESEAERKAARKALREMRKQEKADAAAAAERAGEVGAAGNDDGASEDAKPADEAVADTGAEGEAGAEATVTDPTTGASVSRADEAKKARRKESPLSVAERFAMAFVSYEVGASGKHTNSVFRDTAERDLFRSLKERPPRQPAGGKVPKARVVNVVGGPRKKESMEVSIGLLRVDGISELRLEMSRIERGWVVKTVRG